MPIVFILTRLMIAMDYILLAMVTLTVTCSALWSFPQERK